MTYPSFKNQDAQVIFDIGYSHALIARTAQLLEMLSGDDMGDPFNEVIEQLRDDITTFQQGRCQSRDDIFMTVYKQRQYLV